MDEIVFSYELLAKNHLFLGPLTRNNLYFALYFHA